MTEYAAKKLAAAKARDEAAAAVGRPARLAAIRAQILADQASGAKRDAK